MVRTLLLLECLATFSLGLPACAHDPWTRTDTAFQLACAAADLIDWHQTRQLVSRPGMWENNPYLGHHPSTAAVDRYFAASLVTSAAVSYLLPARWRRAHQVFILSLEGYCIQRNLQIGISVRF